MTMPATTYLTHTLAASAQLECVTRVIEKTAHRQEMSTKVNLKDVGWMYQSTPSSEQRQVFIPPPSQIPMLGMQEELPPQELQPMYFKATDTPYIMLAKQGGRPDLLRYREWKPVDKPPNGTHQAHANQTRCDWYYLEDIALEEAMKKENLQEEKFVSQTPEYMVHEEFKPPRRGAHSTLGKSSGPGVSQPTPYGYGVRQAKSKEREAHRKGSQPRNPNLLPPAGMPSHYSHGKSQGEIEESNDIGKILSYSFGARSLEGKVSAGKSVTKANLPSPGRTMAKAASKLNK